MIPALAEAARNINSAAEEIKYPVFGKEVIEWLN